MKYISTRGTAPVLDFEDTLLAGLAADGGLYVPESWPRLSRETLTSFKDKPYAEVAYEVLNPFIGGTPNNDRFREILEAAYQAFEVPEVAPVIPLGGQHYLLELFHGPTLAFKDVAMQLLARLMDEALARRGLAVMVGEGSEWEEAKSDRLQLVVTDGVRIRCEGAEQLVRRVRRRQRRR